MRILTLTLYLGLLLVGTPREGHAFGENKLGQANEFYQPAFIIDETKFPLFPQEQELSSFPDAIDEDSDLQELSDYYQTVAQAYQNWEKEQKKSVQTMQVNLINAREKTFWKNNCVAHFKSYPSLAQINYKTMAYHQDKYAKENYKWRLIAKKVEFY